MAENKKNEVVSTTNNYKTALVKQSETYTNMLTTSFNEMQLEFTPYKKVCALNAVFKMDELLRSEGLDWKSINSANVTQILEQITLLDINVSASPREGYVIVRKDKQADGNYIVKFEFGIEGNGNDALLRKYGVDIKDVKGPFVVREGDEFTYPYFDGEKMNPPTWKPNSYYKKAIKVFYIVTKTDGSKEYLISEREEVVKNLQAHISNNLMWVPENLKNPILEKISKMTLEEILADKTLRNKVNYTDSYGKQKSTTIISSAWGAAHSSEDMIIRKMKNNATKKYPKDFSSSYIGKAYEDTFEDYDQYRKNVKEPPTDAINVTDINNQADNDIGSEELPKTISQSVAAKVEGEKIVVETVKDDKETKIKNDTPDW